jgi:hypothetical protein
MFKYFNILFSKFSSFFGYDKEVFFCIVNINSATEEVVLQVKHKSLTLTCTFSEAINDMSIVNHLSANEACYLGGYFGRALKKGSGRSEALRQAKSKPFLLQNTKSKYQILYQNRTGDIGYFDMKSKKEFIDNPVSLASNKYIMSNFNSCQACYIGILAGIFMEKAISHDKKQGKNIRGRPALRVVK